MVLKPFDIKVLLIDYFWRGACLIFKLSTAVYVLILWETTGDYKINLIVNLMAKTDSVPPW